MIQLTPTAAFMLYLAMTLASILILWTYHHFKFRNKIIVSSDQTLFICEYCHGTYLVDPIKKVTQCPKCHCLNKMNKHHSFVLISALTPLVFLDGIGIYGTVMHYALIIALSASTLLIFLYFWRSGRLDMDEGPKLQMMEEQDEP